MTAEILPSAKSSIVALGSGAKSESHAPRQRVRILRTKDANVHQRIHVSKTRCGVRKGCQVRNRVRLPVAFRLCLTGFYHEKRDEIRNVGLGPEHDWSSHSADAFGLMAIDYEEPAQSANFNRSLNYGDNGWR